MEELKLTINTYAYTTTLISNYECNFLHYLTNLCIDCSAKGQYKIVVWNGNGLQFEFPFASYTTYQAIIELCNIFNNQYHLIQELIHEKPKESNEEYEIGKSIASIDL